MIKNFVQKYGWKNIALLGVTIITTAIAIIMGIYAVQTVMKTKLKADILPAYKTEIYVQDPTDDSWDLIFKNFGTVTIAGDTSLEGDKLILSQDFIDDYGQDFSLKIYNYNDFAMQVTITSSATTATGATGMEAEIDKPSQVISASSFATFVITNNPVMTQTITLKLEFDEVPPYTVTYNVTNGTSGSDEAIFGQDYSLTLTANDGYFLQDEIIVIGVLSGGYSWDKSTGVFAITDWAKVTNDIEIFCEAITRYTLIAGPDFATYVGAPQLSPMGFVMANDSTKIIFGKYSEYQTKFPDWSRGDPVDDKEAGTIRTFGENGGMIAYVLSDGLIYANPDSSNMFSNYSGLEEVVFDNFYTDNVTTMNAMFNGNLYLTTLDLSGWDTTNVKNMSNMFAMCSNLKTIYVSDKWSTGSVELSGGMFSKCDDLIGGNGTRFNNSCIDKTYARFDEEGQPGYFTRLGDVNIFGKELPDNVTSLTFGLHSQYSSSVDTWDSGTSTNNSNIKMFASGTNCYFLSNSGDINLNKQTLRAISDYSNIIQSFTSAVFKNCKLSGDASYAFTDCKLRSLDLSGFDTTNVTNMGGMFYGCYNLTTLNLSSFNTSNVTNMNSMFSSCSNLTTLNLSNFNTSNVTGMNSMFFGCSNLTTLDLSNFNTSNVTNMNSMFSSCFSLTTLNLSSFNTTKVTDMSRMFWVSESLTTLDLSSFNTTNVTNMNNMFFWCDSLTTIYVGDTWSTASVTNSSAMFEGCAKLVGGAGTTYNSSKINGEYARVDGGPNSATPGYFTDIKDKPTT